MKNCKKCGTRLKGHDTGIRVPIEPYNPEDPYDGAYKNLVFRFCPKCDTTPKTK